MWEHRWTTIAVAYFLGVVLADVFSQPHQNFTGLLALIPVLLALEWSPLVVVVGSVPLVVLAGSDVFGGPNSTTEGTIVRTIGVTVGVGIGVYMAHVREHRTTALSLSRAAAVAARDAILPAVPAVVAGYRFATAYRSAADESHIGGDFYKVLSTDYGVRVIVGDVRGKGLGSIAMTSAVLGCFREWAPEVSTLKGLVARLDSRVVEKGEEGDFVTAVVAAVDHEGCMEVAICGHPSPIHLTPHGPKGGSIAEHGTRPLGLEPDPNLVTVALSPGDRVLFYTDGLIESRDQTGNWIELDEDLIGLLGVDPMESALDGLLSRLETRAVVLQDDLALLLVECPPIEDHP
jgi:sigma-B regulation protein RsbU (phosphoserine phosphatase)